MSYVALLPQQPVLDDQDDDDDDGDYDDVISHGTNATEQQSVTKEKKPKAAANAKSVEKFCQRKTGQIE